MAVPLAALTELHARVEDRVRHVNEQVRDDHHDGDHENDSLYCRKVALIHSGNEKPPDAWNPEDLLEDDGATKQDWYADSDQRQNGDSRVLQRVPPHQRALAQSLRPGGTDIVLAQDVEHLRARQSHDAARLLRAKDERRRNHDLQV